MEKEEIKEIISATVEELLHKNMIQQDRDMCYKYMSKKLFDYFSSGKVDNAIEHALIKIEDDPWYKIIILYYEDRRTVEAVAEELECNITTIIRNKKRLGLQLYESVYSPV